MQTHDPHNAHRDPHRRPADECTGHHHGAPHDGPHDCRPPLRNINHKEDFPLPLTLRDSRGAPLRIPDYDFTIRLTAGSTEYFAGRFNGRLVNCRPSRHDYCTLVVFCTDHRFPPCPELMAEITYHVPDADYGCRGFRNIVRRQPTGVCLTVRRSDLPGWADFDGLPEHSCGCDTISQNEIDDMWLRLRAPMHHPGCRPDPRPPHHPHPHPPHGPCGAAHHESISPHDLDSMWQRFEADTHRK